MGTNTNNSGCPFASKAGNAGETHQTTNDRDATLTTAQGAPIADNQNWLKMGNRGPMLLEDHIAREKIFHFDHERIPERVVHARGYAAHGYFETYASLQDTTCADLFARAGEKTPVFARFSTVAGNKGSADLARDVRGFAVKFYTKEGNWDLVGNNIPVFFIQDAMKFPDLIHATKAEPDRGFPQAQTAHDNFWDFVSLTPESMHMLTWIMSDRTVPRSLRFMEGFGVHTFRFLDKAGKSTYVKFHWKPKLGMQSVLWDEAVKINGADPDFHRRDMWNALGADDYPEWELGVQLFDEAFAEKFDFDVLDSTKLIPEEEVPVKPIGRMVLDRQVDNYFAETEQVAFCTQNMVRGIDHSNDPLLQGRNFSYLDTQTKRLGGPNFTHIPINAPKCPFSNFQQDGHMAMHARKGRVNYEPNSWGEDSGPRENPDLGFQSHSEPAQGAKTRHRSETFADHYSQAKQFYKSQTAIEQEHMQSAFSFELSKVKREDIRERMIAHLLNIDTTLAEKVAEQLGISELPDAIKPAIQPKDTLKPSAALSILKNPPGTFKGRKVGVIISDGTSAKTLSNVKSKVSEQGGTVEIIANKVSGLTLDDGTSVNADERVSGAPSVLYDAVAILVNPDKTDDYFSMKPLQDFVSDAYHHMKFMGFEKHLIKPIEKILGKEPSTGCFIVNEETGLDEFSSKLKELRCWDRA